MKTLTHVIEIPVYEDLLLREVTLDDAPAIFKLIDSNRNYLEKWLPFVKHSKRVSDTEAFIKSVSENNNLSEIVFTIIYKQQYAGIIGFKDIDYANLKLEIGYWLIESLQHKGIMVRSCTALINYAFKIMQMNRIQIKVGIGNKRSNNIPKKLGFTYEGTERDGEQLGPDQFRDLEVYSLLRREWIKQQSSIL